MGLKDPHDPREFTHFAKLNADGTVAAIVEVADASVATSHPDLVSDNVHVDVTDLRRKVDIGSLRIDPAIIEESRSVASPFRFDLIRAVSVAALKQNIDAIFDGPDADRVK